MSRFDELNGTFAQVENALTALDAAPEQMDEGRERLEASLCLSTREAYADFHSLSLVHETIDPQAKQKLASLLKRAITALHSPEFGSAVTDRRQDFEEFCRMMESSPDLLKMVLADFE